MRVRHLGIRGFGVSESSYNRAAICENGHVVSEYAEITPTPEAESRGWAAAFGDPVVLGVKVKTGRGERI